jgi:hypothetical protein
MPKAVKGAKKALEDDETEEVEEEDVEEDEGAEEEAEDEEAEADEEEAPKKTAKARSRVRKRQDRAKRVRVRAIGAFIAILFIVGIAGAYLYTPAPASITVVEFNPSTTTGIDLIISTTGGGVRGYNGKINLRASIGGNQTMSKDVAIRSNIANVYLPYSDFVTQNGNYTFTAGVGSAKGTTQVTIDNVVEGFAWNEPFGTRDMDLDPPHRSIYKTVVTISMNFVRQISATKNETVTAKPGQSVILELTDPSGHKTTTPDINVSLKGFLLYPYDALKPGTYSVKATFVNNHIQTGSKYWSVVSSREFHVNAKPLAEAGPDQTKTLIPSIGATVKVDGSGSKDDGGIVSYEWNFGVYLDPDDPNWGKDTVTSTKPTAEWTYTSVDSYTVSLTVKDNGVPGVTNTTKYDADSLIVTIN